MKPDISVIMSAYNSGKYLDESINSILNQSYRNWELIIIDDKSSDNSVKIVRKYMKKSKRIVLIRNKNNMGPAASRNKGIKAAKAKYIAILDSDDVALKNRLKIQYNFLKKHPEIFLVGGKAIKIDSNSKKIGESLKPVIGFPKVAKTLPKMNCIIHPSVMFRNDLKTSYRTKFLYSHDYDLYLMLLTRNKNLDNLNKPLIKYRMHKSSVSIQSAAMQKAFAMKVKEFYKQRTATGKDEYSTFNNKSILNLKEMDESAIEYSRIRSFIENNKCSDARSEIFRVFFKGYNERRIRRTLLIKLFILSILGPNTIHKIKDKLV